MSLSLSEGRTWPLFLSPSLLTESTKQQRKFSVFSHFKRSLPQFALPSILAVPKCSFRSIHKRFHVDLNFPSQTGSRKQPTTEPYRHSTLCAFTHSKVPLRFLVAHTQEAPEREKLQLTKRPTRSLNVITLQAASSRRFIPLSSVAERLDQQIPT